MKKHEIAQLFRTRVSSLIDRMGGPGAFARAVGVDRSALSQFLDADADRLPRAETLRRIGEAGGVSLDWLLGLSNVENARPEIASRVEIEDASAANGSSPLADWHLEAAGYKIRYVPMRLPDLLRHEAVADYEFDPSEADHKFDQTERQLAYSRLPDSDLEICMPINTIIDLARGDGVWAALPRSLRQVQLEHMARLVDELYPALRLFLYDGRRTYSAPYTVFGPIRAAVYLGGVYLVLTDLDQIRALARHFDHLIRSAVCTPDRAGDRLRDMR